MADLLINEAELGSRSEVAVNAFTVGFSPCRPGMPAVMSDIAGRAMEADGMVREASSSMVLWDALAPVTASRIARTAKSVEEASLFSSAPNDWISSSNADEIGADENTNGAGSSWAASAAVTSLVVGSQVPNGSAGGTFVPI